MISLKSPLFCSQKRFRIDKKMYFSFKERLNHLCYCYMVYRCKRFLDEKVMKQICRRSIQQRVLGRKALPPLWKVPKSQSSGRRRPGEAVGLQHPSQILWGTARGRTSRSEAPWSLPGWEFSDFKVGGVPVVWLAAEQAAACGAGEALGSIDVHMQGIAGCWDAARARRTFWVVPWAKTTAQNQDITIPGIGDSFFRGFVPSVTY